MVIIYFYQNTKLCGQNPVVLNKNFKFKLKQFL